MIEKYFSIRYDNGACKFIKNKYYVLFIFFIFQLAVGTVFQLSVVRYDGRLQKIVMSDI